MNIGRTTSSLMVAALVAIVAGALGRAQGAWTPSSELSFRVSVVPDTITVGDPIDFEMSGAGPLDAQLLWPELADSIGPFDLLDVGATSRIEDEGMARLSQGATVTLYRSGAHTLPSIPLLAVRSGDTLVAYGATPTVFVRSLLPEDPSLQNPQTALAQLKEVKGVVPLEPSRWWAWVAGGILLAAIGFLVYRLWKRRKVAPVAALPRRRPVLPPDIAFEQGLAKLRERLDRGEVKEFYAGLSILLRTYMERRFGVHALEATRTELLATVRDHPYLDADDERWLADFLTESDLVKFARLDRLLDDARARADASLQWVRETTRREADRLARAVLEAPVLATATSPFVPPQASSNVSGSAPATSAPATSAPATSAPATSASLRTVPREPAGSSSAGTVPASLPIAPSNENGASSSPRGGDLR